MGWKKLKTTKLFSHPRLEVFEDEVELPNGHKTKYLYFGDKFDAATVIAVNKTGQVLLQKEYSYPQNKKLFQFPGGGLEAGETPAQGAARELAEEAGLQGTLTEIGWFYPNNRRGKNKMYVFMAKACRPLQPPRTWKKISKIFGVRH
jgi:ADP-ribose pyrophosphatase